MKQETKNPFRKGLYMLAAFFLWTAGVRTLDVRPIGPQDSAVGFASLNRFVHTLTGVHMGLYDLTDLLSLIPLLLVAGFGILGLVQWIRRKRLLQVDADILILGGFYAVTLACFVLFELFPMNYRPVLINGVLEASYPSSTTMLTLCVMPTAVLQLRNRIRNPRLKGLLCSAMTVFALFIVICRLISGVHWFTDIVGGTLLSAGLVLLYRASVQARKP